MPDKVIIEIYRAKNADELTKLIADPDSRLETGSASALEAATAAALLCRAAEITKRNCEGERLDYIARNCEILRSYMVHLIDEDVKCRGPLRRAMKEGGAREQEAARRPAVAINEEIVNMMGQLLELNRELCGVCPTEARHYAVESAETALAAVRCSVSYILNMAEKSREETYRFVTRRENEIAVEKAEALYAEIVKD